MALAEVIPLCIPCACCGAPLPRTTTVRSCGPCFDALVIRRGVIYCGRHERPTQGKVTR